MSLTPPGRRNFLEAMRLFPKNWEDFSHLLPDFGDEFTASGLNVYEDKKNNFVIEAEMPGFTEEEINVDLNNGVLWISAEKKEKEEDKDRKYIKKTTSSRSYRYTLPVQVDENQEPDASFKDGILQITFRKGKDSKNKKIPIKSK